MKHGRLLPILALLFSATSWGATFVLVKAAIALVDTELFIAARFVLAAAILLGVAGALRQRSSRELWRNGALLGVLLGIGYWLQTLGLERISPSRSAFLTGLAVVLIPLADRLLLGRRVHPRAAGAAILALAGTAILTGGWSGDMTAGDVLTLGCAAVFALHIVMNAVYAPRHPAVALTAAQCAVVGTGMLPFALGQPAAPLGDPLVLTAVLVSAIVTTAVAFLLMIWAQARLTATEAGIVLSFEPVAAAITAWAWEGEAPTATLFAGGALILAAMVLSQINGSAGTLAGGGPGHDVPRSPDPRHQ